MDSLGVKCEQLGSQMLTMQIDSYFCIQKKHGSTWYKDLILTNKYNTKKICHTVNEKKNQQN